MPQEIDGAALSRRWRLVSNLITITELKTNSIEAKQYIEFVVNMHCRHIRDTVRSKTTRTIVKKKNKDGHK